MGEALMLPEDTEQVVNEIVNALTDDDLIEIENTIALTAREIAIADFKKNVSGKTWAGDVVCYDNGETADQVLTRWAFMCGLHKGRLRHLYHSLAKQTAFAIRRRLQNK